MSTKLFKTLAATAVVVALFGCNNDHHHHHKPGPTPEEPFALNVIHMNDLHSQFDGDEGHFTINTAGRPETYYTTFGGYPRVLQQVKDDLDKNNKAQLPSLVLNAGDSFQGSIYFQVYDGEANANLLKNMKIDAMAVGNHEFDLGTKPLAMFANTVNFPMLADNMDASNNNDLKGISSIKPYQLFAYKGTSKRKINNTADAKSDEVTVAVIGVALENMSDFVRTSRLGGVTFSSEIDSTQQEVDTLKKLGVNKIVVVSHIGLAADEALAKGTTGIDLIVGGHSHTLLGDFSNIGLSKNGQYAEMISQKTGDAKTCIVQAGSNAQAVGDVTVQFDKDGNVLTCQGENTILSSDDFYIAEGRFDSDKVDQSQKLFIENYIAALNHKNLQIVSEDSSLRTRITNDYKNGYDKALGDKVADVIHTLYQIRRPGDESETGGYREQSDDQVKECASDNTLSCFHGSQVAPIVGQSFLDWTNSKAVKDALGFNADDSVQVAFVAAGGVRQNISAGELHSGNISLELLPFSNHLTVMSLTGSQIKDILKQTITPVLVQSEHAGKYPYVAGMRYKYVESTTKDSKDKPQGDVTEAQIRTKNNDGSITWDNVVDTNRYNVVIGNYNANGNDGWGAIAEDQISDPLTARQDLYVTVDEQGAVTPVAVKDVILKKESDTEGNISYKPSENEPKCKEAGEYCNTDARAFVEYSKANSSNLTTLDYNTATLVRQPKS